MKTDNIMLDKSFQFGLRIVKLFIHLRKAKVERELFIQLLKSGTSIGVNIKNQLKVHQGKTLFTNWKSLIMKPEKQGIGQGC